VWRGHIQTATSGSKYVTTRVRDLPLLHKQRCGRPLAAEDVSVPQTSLACRYLLERACPISVQRICLRLWGDVPTAMYVAGVCSCLLLQDLVESCAREVVE